MKHAVIRRDELLNATLQLGGTTLSLADYATTGVRAIAIGPSGSGKTSLGLLMAEQLSEQGWVAVLVDPEGEIASLYGDPVESPEALSTLLRTRTKPIVVVSVRDANEFVPYGRAILEAADRHRKPIFVVIDEGQLFSSSRRRKDGLGEAGDLINDLVARGRKRALDLFFTAQRFSGTIHRSIITNKNITLIGTQEDPTAWSALAPLCRSAKIDYSDLSTLSPGEFYVFARHGVEKLRVQMAKALARVAPKAKKPKPVLPTKFQDWSRAVTAIPTQRMEALTPEITSLLCTIAGVSAQQSRAGFNALADELATRA